MSKENNHIEFEILIVRYLANEANMDEIALLENWVKEDVSHREYFNEVRKVWEVSNQHIQTDVNIDSEWRKIESKLFIDKDIDSNISIEKRNIFGRSGFRIAASLIVLFSIGFLSYMMIFGSNTDNLVANNSIEETTLIDGTIVTLNQNSSLEFFTKNNGDREVILSGEAFFDVVPIPSRPFIITTQNLKIKVLGTSFYVNSHEDMNSIEVIVKTGKVAISIPDKREIIITAGEMGIYDKLNKDLYQVENNDLNYISWKTKSFRFIDTKLSSVIRTINKVYNSNIVIGNSAINDCTITVSFDDQTFDTILNVLIETLDLNIEKDEANIYLSGEGC